MGAMAGDRPVEARSDRGAVEGRVGHDWNADPSRGRPRRSGRQSRIAAAGRRLPLRRRGGIPDFAERTRHQSGGVDHRRAGDIRRFLDFALCLRSAAIRRPRRPLDTTKAIADCSRDGLVVTDADSRIVYANEAYRVLSGAAGAADLKLVERLFTGAPEVSEAVYRLAQAAHAGKARGRGIAHGPAPDRRRRGGLVPHPRAPARGHRQGGRDALGDLRHHPRTRAARELLSRLATRHRLSRPRAGGLLFRRTRRLDRAHERHPRQLARLRHRAIRGGTTQALRHRGRRRRGLAQHRLRPPRGGDDRALRRRSQAS